MFWNARSCLAVIFLLCAPGILQGQRTTPGARPAGGVIDVQVRNPDGTPGPRDLHVRLESAEGGAEADAETVDGGKCQFHLATGGVFFVRLHEQGYQDISERIELIGTNHGFATLTLRRLSASEGPGGETPNPVPPETAVSVREVNIPEKARQEFAKAEQALRERQFVESEKHLHKALKIYEHYPQAYRMLGEIYLERQEWGQAEQFLNRSIALEPEFAAAYIDLGAVYNQQKNYPKAEEALKNGLKLSPASPAAEYEIAKTYWAMKRWQEAAPFAKAAVSALPDLAPTHVLYGNILLKQGDAAGAVREYEEYLRLDPNGAMAGDVRQQVNKLEKALER